MLGSESCCGSPPISDHLANLDATCSDAIGELTCKATTIRVIVGEHGHAFDVARDDIGQRVHPTSGAGRPCTEAGRLMRGQRGLDALAYRHAPEIVRRR